MELFFELLLVSLVIVRSFNHAGSVHKPISGIEGHVRELPFVVVYFKGSIILNLPAVVVHGELLGSSLVGMIPFEHDGFYLIFGGKIFFIIDHIGREVLNVDVD